MRKLASSLFLTSILAANGCGSGLDIAQKPVIYNLMVDIPAAFDIDVANDAPTFFGGTVTSPSGPKIIPNIEFKVLKTAIVRSPVRGVISTISDNGSQGDFAISIVTGALSAYRIELDHVLDVKVKEGDIVDAGQELGLPGNWSATMGRIELQINRGGDYVCPMDYLATSVRSAIRAQVNTLMADWETAKGDTSLYDESAMVIPGCVVHSIVD